MQYILMSASFLPNLHFVQKGFHNYWVQTLVLQPTRQATFVYMHYYSNSYFLVLVIKRGNCIRKLINSRTDLYPSTSTLAITLVHIPRLFVDALALNTKNGNAVITPIRAEWHLKPGSGLQKTWKWRGSDIHSRDSHSEKNSQESKNTFSRKQSFPFKNIAEKEALCWSTKSITKKDITAPL